MCSFVRGSLLAASVVLPSTGESPPVSRGARGRVRNITGDLPADAIDAEDLEIQVTPLRLWRSGAIARHGRYVGWHLNHHDASRAHGG